MIAFIVAHWWTWPLVWAACGAFFAGFTHQDGAEFAWSIVLGPLMLVALLGAFIRGILP